jgi:thiol-disulfide isomerase/thioredoxin
MLFLQPQDYYINPDGQLCMSLKGFSMVFYTSDRCTICKKLKPQFNRLSKTIQGCIFAYMDVDQENMKIRKMAAQVGSPINHVPILTLFLNGVPTALFNLNEKTQNFGEDLRQWLIKTTSAIVKSSSHDDNEDRRHVMDDQGGDDQSCPTSIGRPKPGRRHTSYKTYDGAYTV